MSEVIYVADVAPYRHTGDTVRLAGVHQSLMSAARACREIADVHGLGCLVAENVEELTTTVLERARVLVLFTIGETGWSQEQRTLIEARVATGRMGLIGLHSTTDSAYGWARFGSLLGARFAGHPVTGDLPVSVVGPTHAATTHLPSSWLFRDELYVFHALVPDATVLLAVDPDELTGNDRARLMAHLAPHDPVMEPPRLPIAWCIQRGPMRTFYTSLGHFLAAYEDQNYLEHLSGAVRWILSGDNAIVGAAT
jgi:type 1 glutamine amidotransferase